MKTTNFSGAAHLGRFCAIAFVLLPAAVWADCAQWDATGGWTLKQNNNIAVSMDLRQTKEVISGAASFVAIEKHSGFQFNGEETRVGSVRGTMKGNQFAIEISYRVGETGVYRGVVNSKGIIEGGVYSKEDPKNGSKQHAWTSSRAMQCTSFAPGSRNPTAGDFSSDVAAAAQDTARTVIPPKPTPVPKTIHHTGPGGTPLDPKNPVQKKMLDSIEARKTQGAPTITANPRTVSIPAGQSEGTTTLTWDGGNAHPYAEVWVKVGDEDETKIVEQGKGSRQVKVKLGKIYLYSLSDSGERLATVTVKTQ
jgi:hypothetical protein